MSLILAHQRHANIQQADSRTFKAVLEKQDGKIAVPYLTKTLHQ